MKFSLIGWTHHTWNPWWGCNKVSAECKHFYIDSIMRRAGREPFNGPIRTSAATWDAPFSWNRIAIREGESYRVFTCSMSDFFHVKADKWRTDAWQVIRECKHLIFLILTKRSDRIASCLPPDWGDGYPNVWLGVTAGTKKSMWRIPYVQAIPARVRFISAEPLLEHLDFSPYLDGSIGWIITGCEQAHKDRRRVMDIAWVRDIDFQCRVAGIAHYFKQYYFDEKGVPVTDGMLDGVCRQEFPHVTG